MARSTLPAPGTPLRTADGAAIPPTPSATHSVQEVVNGTKAQRLVSQTKRKLADLPAVPQHMHAYSALIVYTICGLSDSEIALAMSLSVQQVRKLREQPAYAEIERNIIDTVKQQTATEVADILAQHEVDAAHNIGTLMGSQDEKIALAAAKDILDRRGHAPKQVIDLRAQMAQTFIIEHVDRRGLETLTVDMHPDVVEED